MGNLISGEVQVRVGRLTPVGHSHLIRKILKMWRAYTQIYLS